VGNRKVKISHTKPGVLENGFELVFQTAKGEQLKLRDSKEGFAVAEGIGTSNYTAVFRYLSTGNALVTEVDKNATDRLYQDVLGVWN
jgi:hypothetical protein